MSLGSHMLSQLELGSISRIYNICTINMYRHICMLSAVRLLKEAAVVWSVMIPATETPRMALCIAKLPTLGTAEFGNFLLPTIIQYTV